MKLFNAIHIEFKKASRHGLLNLLGNGLKTKGNGKEEQVFPQEPDNFLLDWDFRVLGNLHGFKTVLK